LILGVFLVVVGLNAIKRRFWCRYLCPLGALLGVFSWRPFWRRAVKDSCNECDLCGGPCEGAATTAAGDHWKATECLGCLNCTDACNRDSVTFTWTWPWSRVPRIEPVNLPRRAALASALGGLAGLVLLRINPQARGKTIDPDLIRPPGARPEREFLQRCTACGLCLEVCPTGGLQPTFLEAGLEGLWTPRLVPRIGCCEQECNLCTQVCPTQALEPLTLQAKKEWRLGLAFFDTGRCIPYAFGRNCGVCEECCPVPDKAIFVVEVEVTDRDGQKQTINQPHVDPTRCTGCGKCEKKCLFQDRPAIRVTSANETRNEGNRPIL
jgi:MauM/NapG family ferredoxin protein